MLNYTQGKQLNLLKDIGFESPGWEDLSYVLIGMVVFVSATGAAWTLWEQSQHDPWLRLLGKVRKRLAKAGIESSAASTPRQLSSLLPAHWKAEPDGQALHNWLLQLEAQRYANAPRKGRASPAFKQLQQQFKTLSWPA